MQSDSEKWWIAELVVWLGTIACITGGVVKSWTMLTLVAIGVTMSAIRWRRLRQNLARYWNRGCRGAQWRRRFPDAIKGDIRQFLDLFVDAFAFARKRRLAFAPDDRIMDVYRALYSPPLGADSLELENFATGVQERYGLDLGAGWHDDLTLGEVFGEATLSGSRPGHGPLPQGAASAPSGAPDDVHPLSPRASTMRLVAGVVLLLLMLVAIGVTIIPWLTFWDGSRIVFASLAIVLVLVAQFPERGRCFWRTGGRLDQWRRRFPDATAIEISRFLSLFAESFSFRPKDRLAFSPDDAIGDILSRLYPPGKQTVDEFDCELLEASLKDAYGVTIEPSEQASMTLGEVFARVASR